MNLSLLRVLWTPIVAGFVVLVPGLLSLATGQVLLFPSLAPTAAIQAHNPADHAARFYNVVVGHLGGLASACAVVLTLGLADAPSVFVAQQVTPLRVVAAVLSVMLALFVEKLFHAFHPTAASTTLLVALGSFKPVWQDVAQITFGVLIVATVGEGFRRLSLHLHPRDETAPEQVMVSSGLHRRAHL
jgi:hypothetical protein